MRLVRLFFVAVMLMASLCTVRAADSANAFLGRWDLTLKAPDREWPSWLELREEGGQLKADMVGRWGNARPLPKVSCRMPSTSV